MENRLHAFFHGHVGRGKREAAGGDGIERTDFVAQHGARDLRRDGALPPVGVERGRVVRAGALEGHRHGLRGASGHARGAFGRGGVGGVVEPRLVDLELIRGLHAHGDRLARGGGGQGRELRGGRSAVAVQRGVVKNVGGGAGVRVRAGPEVGRGGSEAGADDRLPRLGTRRADDVARGALRGEFFRHAADELHLLEAEVGVRGGAGRVVAARGEARAHLRIQVGAAVERHEDVFRRAVGVRGEAQVRRVAHERDLRGVGVGRVAVRAVFAQHADGRDGHAVFRDVDGMDRG